MPQEIDWDASMAEAAQRIKESTQTWPKRWHDDNHFIPEGTAISGIYVGDRKWTPPGREVYSPMLFRVIVDREDGKLGEVQWRGSQEKAWAFPAGHESENPPEPGDGIMILAGSTFVMTKGRQPGKMSQSMNVAILARGLRPDLAEAYANGSLTVETSEELFYGLSKEARPTAPPSTVSDQASEPEGETGGFRLVDQDLSFNRFKSLVAKLGDGEKAEVLRLAKAGSDPIQSADGWATVYTQTKKFFIWLIDSSEMSEEDRSSFDAALKVVTGDRVASDELSEYGYSLKVPLNLHLNTLKELVASILSRKKASTAKKSPTQQIADAFPGAEEITEENIFG